MRNPGLVARKPLVYSLGEGKIGGGDGGGVVGSGLGSDSGLSTLTLALSLPGRGNKTASPLRGRGVVQRSPQGRRRKIGRVGGLVAASVVRHAPPRDCGAAHHERLRVWFPSTSSGQALRASEGLRGGSPRTVEGVATRREEGSRSPFGRLRAGSRGTFGMTEGPRTGEKRRSRFLGVPRNDRGETSG